MGACKLPGNGSAYPADRRQCKQGDAFSPAGHGGKRGKIRTACEGALGNREWASLDTGHSF